MEIADLGFSKGKIVETILSTYNKDGKANAAPMGVTVDNLYRVIIRIYTSTLTYNNLQAKKSGVVNVISDADVFYRTAFKDANPNGEIPQDWFEKAETVDAPKLRKAKANIEVAVVDIKQFDTEIAEVLCNVKLVQTVKVLPKVYCRALFATVEAIIHATRVQAFITHADKQKREQALKLLEMIRGYRELVNRVAPNSNYSEIMEDLKQRIDSWRSKGESLR